MTSDFDRRFHDHNNWYNRSTKHYAPFRLIYIENCNSSSEARIREKYLTSWAWKNKIKDMIVGPDKSG